jgi:hypothetical protein
MSDLDPTEINALAILGADPDVRELAALETLHTMAVLAVQARRMTVEQRAKRLRKLESLEVVTLGEIVDAQQKRAGIELDTEPRDADRWKPCAGCRMPIARGCAVRCDECERPLCAGGCGERGPKGCMTPRRVAKRHGAPWRCVQCAQAALTPEQRSERSRKARAARSEESLREMGQKGAQAANAARTPEQRVAIARKGNASRSAEVRRSVARNANASQTWEQRSEAARKAVATRKARRASPG